MRSSLAVAVLLVSVPATAEAWDHHHHHSGGGSGSGCSHSSSSSGSSGSIDNGPNAAPPPRLKHVFYTSFLTAGDMAGLAGADALCSRAAQRNSTLGSARAWLATADTAALDRVSEGPFYSVRGELVFDTPESLIGAPLAAITDENGDVPSWQGSAGVFTGADESGVPANGDCRAWTTRNASVTTTLADGSATTCDKPAALLCFEN